MSIEETITELVSIVDDINTNLNPLNDFGNTVGDELHQIEYQLGRVADAVEGILKIMKSKQ